MGSCPSRGTWIEILMSRRPGIGGDGRAPRGARGLKSADCGSIISARQQSCPSRGTWIEINRAGQESRCDGKSCPSRGTWIEMLKGNDGLLYDELGVVPLAGHVD